MLSVVAISPYRSRLKFMTDVFSSSSCLICRSARESNNTCLSIVKASYGSYTSRERGPFPMHFIVFPMILLFCIYIFSLGGGTLHSFRRVLTFTVNLLVSVFTCSSSSLTLRSFLFHCSKSCPINCFTIDSRRLSTIFIVFI